MGEFFVRRPIVAMVLSIIIVLVGLLALRSTPISQYPDITPPTIKINTSFVGANAVNVEQGVASVIEQKINGVEANASPASTERLRFRTPGHHMPENGLGKKNSMAR